MTKWPRQWMPWPAATMAAFASACIGACSPSPAAEATDAKDQVGALLLPASLPPGVERLSLAPSFFAETDATGENLGAALDLIPPIPYPVATERHRVRIVVRLPTGAALDVNAIPAGSAAVAPALVFPVGTWIARVEEIELKRGGTAIVDVRGAHFSESGERFYVLRPAFEGIQAPLLGLSWKRDDIPAEQAAHKRLATEMKTTTWGFLRRPPSEKIAKRAQHFITIGRCSACHERGRGDFLTVANKGDRRGFFPRRGVDANGYYAPASLFRTAQPISNYGIQSLAGAHYQTRCTEGAKCSDAAPNWVSIDLTRAINANDPHALAACASAAEVTRAASPTAQEKLARLLPPCPTTRAAPPSIDSRVKAQ